MTYIPKNSPKVVEGVCLFRSSVGKFVNWDATVGPDMFCLSELTTLMPMM